MVKFIVIVLSLNKSDEPVKIGEVSRGEGIPPIRELSLCHVTGVGPMSVQELYSLIRMVLPARDSI